EPVENPIDYLRAKLAEFRATIEAGLAQRQTAFSDFLKTHGDLPFLGGFVGYMGYGACGYTEKIVQQSKDIVAVPDGYYGLYDA
ncbi:hypothetical protein ABTH41_20005, partial [Acinetobacter baumannii]